MKILVTGGAGFIGSNIVDALIDDGHKVTIIDDLSSGLEKNINSKARFIKQNICDNKISSIFEKEKFDLVNHHAAQIDVRKSVAEPLFDAGINILGTINLLQNCIEFGVKKFMFASTGGAIYGEQEYFPADDNHPTNPISPYGITKLAIEKYLNFYHLEYKLLYTILRYANVYGPRQNALGDAGVVAIFTNKLLNNEQPTINGTGKQTRDYVYVDDVVKANLLTLQDDNCETFNVGNGIEKDVNELFITLNKITGNKAKEKHGPALKGEQMRSSISSDRFFNKFNWKPETSLEEGLRKTVEYYKNELNK